MATGGTIYVRVKDEATPVLEWAGFVLWEFEAARQGSGLTQEQMRGAAVYHDWLVERRREAAEAEDAA